MPTNMKKKNTSDFSQAKAKGQLVKLGYKDFLSPDGRKLKQTYAKIKLHSA